MTILHVVAGLPPEGGGLSEVVPGYCRGLAKAGCIVHLATLDGPLSATVARARQAGVNVHLFRPAFRHTILYSGALRRGLSSLVQCADLVHVHSNWTFPVWWACHTALCQQKPLVMSPHGCLFPERLRRSRGRKYMAGVCFDDRYLRRAACLHATAAPEQDAFRAYGLDGPVAVIPNGVEMESFDGPGDGSDFRSRFPACGDKRLLLYLSRLDPIKGLDLLIAAWTRLAPQFPAWHLVIAGPDERGCEAIARSALRSAGREESVTFCGPLYGADRLDALRACELFVLPSRNENFGIAVAEAAYVGRPVITTHGTPWEGLPQHGAGWWVPTDTDALHAALSAALALDTTALLAMGARGRDWIAQDFAWPHVARRLLEAYEWILGRRAQPAFVSD